jgi:hypothetical protein
MKIYSVEFEPMWPVPCGLIIAANDDTEARAIARKTILHTDKFTVKEVDTSKPCVVFYESGDY